MNFTLCSNPPEITSPFLEKPQSISINKPLSTSSIRAGEFANKDSIQVSNRDARKAVLSNQYVSGQVEGTRFMGKPLSNPKQKLEFIRTLLIDNYDSYTYNIYQELSVVNGIPPVVVRNDEWTWEEACYYIYEERAFDNIVISPGPGSPACPTDIGICLKLLLECGDIPILGVCLGHQALGYVHGAEVVHAFEPVHGRLSEIQHTGCSLFRGIPSGRNSGFKVVRYHSLVIDAKSLPKELIPLAWTCSTDTISSLVDQRSNHDAYESQLDQETSLNSFSKVLMGIMHSTRPHYGLQVGLDLFVLPLSLTCQPGHIHPSNCSFILRALPPVTGVRYSKISEILLKIFGARKTLPSLMKEKYSIMVGNGSWQFKENTRNVYPSILDTEYVNMYKMVNSSNVRNGIKFLKLQWRKLENLSCQVGGPKNIFLELFGDKKAKDTFWLDSSSTEKRRARFSFMGGKGGPLWKQITFRLSGASEVTCTSGGHISIEDGQGSTATTFLDDGFFHFMNEELQSIHYDEKDYEGLPFEFYGGYIGYLGYGLKVECGAPYNSHISGTPDACFFFADNLIVIDHSTDDIYVLSISDQTTRTATWLNDVEQKLLSLKTSARKSFPSQTSVQPVNNSQRTSFLYDKTREQYMEDVKKCQNFIKDGESYELCLTTQIRKKIQDVDPLGLYLHLRDKNPAPYAAWLNFSEENLTICCSSPERFLRLDRDGILEAKPIKGTIARGSTPGEDEVLRSQLQQSEKDQAENLMIVDLLRNDLGRVCEPGSVHVPHLMDVETYATVHTMVSTIRGKKKSNLSAIDCVRAAFPGGSMTGAPKLRSMELLDSLESCSRGIYSGCIGFFSYNQTFDLNIVIRTMVLHQGEATIGAGGAIVALSSPEEEYKEMVLKARAPVNAVMEFEHKSLEH